MVFLLVLKIFVCTSYSDQSVVLFDIIPDQFAYSPNALYAINEINLSPEISGCTNIDYCNYNMYATIDDGSCSGSYGCMKKCMLIMILVPCHKLTSVMSHGMTFLFQKHKMKN